MKKFLLFFFAIFVFAAVMPASGNSATGGVITDHEFSVGANVYTNGATAFGLTLQYGNRVTAEKYNVFTTDFFMLKHPKEVRSIARMIEDARPFVFGKRNSLPAMRFSVGRNYILTRQYENRDVLVEFTYRAGVTIGLLKPVYIKVYNGHSDNTTLETVRFDPEQHSPENIYGGAGFFYGFEEITPRLGAGFKSGVAFRWNNENNRYRRLESGIKIDAFPSEIPTFATIDNKQIFLNLYVEYSIGRNW